MVPVICGNIQILVWISTSGRKTSSLSSSFPSSIKHRSGYFFSGAATFTVLLEYIHTPWNSTTYTPVFPLNLPVQIGCRRGKKPQKNPNQNPNILISWQIRLDLCLIFSSASFTGKVERELKAKRLALPIGLQNVRKSSANRLSFRPPVYILRRICSYDSLLKRWEKLNADISRNSFFFKQLLMYLKVMQYYKIKTQTLWWALALRDWDTRADLLRRLAWKRKAALSSMTACSSWSTESWVPQPDQWLPAQLSGHRWLFTAYWQSRSLKGKEAGNLPHLKLSHLGQ